MMFRKIFLSLSVLCILATSCVSTRNSVYFVDQRDATILSSIAVPQTIISPNDLLSITVSSLNPTASSVFNAPNVTYATNTPTNGGGPVQASGYLVDIDGNIQFPILGNIKAAGLTESTLKNQIVRSLVDKKLLIDPVVTIRHMNFRVTVLGEVGNPTVISVPNEKITLLEALGLAGDVTIFGKRDNIMVIREEDGKKIIKRLNLNTSEIFESPYYYLRSNDIVYVEPNKAKVAGSSRVSQLLPIILGGLSLVAIVLDRLTR
jgi:polysaccharide export outer membrane protein